MKPSFCRHLLRIIPLLLVLVIAGCGEIDWFPQYVREPTTPDQFSFEPATGQDKGVPVTSKEIEVTGLTAATSPIKVSGATGSTYSINGGTATSSDGTVANGDKVTVSHKTASTLGTSTTTTLTIGNVSADFVSTTKSFELSAFSQPEQIGGFMISYTDVTTPVGVTQMHLVSIKDTVNLGTAAYQATVLKSLDLTQFTNVKQSLPLSNGERIFVRNTLANASATTTLTIDGVDTVVKLTLPAP
ncbi:hypothetical protein [Geomonas propionica]|uniref:Lipoprotein n=1 Tax=Geomonas propionica TaxID=2798582 RepID=A0ABS0YQX7_9BACT|nr:hypothetical protein [Geomonas propionica]MBJ6800338.1 hypothetical protein [Geomonas propionica]